MSGRDLVAPNLGRRWKSHLWVDRDGGHFCGKCGLRRLASIGGTGGARLYEWPDGRRDSRCGSCPGTEALRRLRRDRPDALHGYTASTVRAPCPRVHSAARVRADLWEFVRSQSVALGCTQSVFIELLIERERLAPVLSRGDAYRYAGSVEGLMLRGVL